MLRFADGDIRCIPNPLDLARYDPRPGPRIPDPAAPRVLWLRSFHRMYEPETAVRAFGRLRARHPGAILTMAGPAKDESLGTTRGVVAELGLDEAVRFPGAVAKNEVPRLMREHDLFLSTARIDNVPVSVTEAAACALPVVATDVGGVPEILDDGDCGVLVPPGDTHATADALLGIVADPSKAERLGAAARRRAERHDLRKVAAAWIDLFRQLGPPSRAVDDSKPPSNESQRGHGSSAALP
jgi:phenylacetate-CoA ligase